MVKKNLKKPSVTLKEQKSITTKLKDGKPIKKQQLQQISSAPEVSTPTTTTTTTTSVEKTNPPPVKQPAKNVVSKLMKSKKIIEIDTIQGGTLKMGKKNNKKPNKSTGVNKNTKSIVNAMQNAIEKHTVKGETTNIEMESKPTSIETSEAAAAAAEATSSPSSSSVVVVAAKKKMKKPFKKLKKSKKIKPEPFDEQLFSTIFSQENITKLVIFTKQITNKLLETRKTIIDEDYVLAIQVTGYRVPLLQSVQVSRILLPHSMETNEQSICLFVKDLKRGRRIDYEPTIEHYRGLLDANKITYNITIVPITKLCTEYSTFELKRTLIHAHDKFLADKCIAAHVNGFLGHRAMMAGRQAIPINMKKKDLHKEMEKQLRKVLYKLVPSGSTQSINVGRASMADGKIAENIIDLLRQLGARIHPGGSANINTVYLKVNMNISTVVPIYKNQSPPPNGIPQVKTIKKRILESEVESIKKNFRKFDVNPDGKIIRKVKRNQLKRSAAKAVSTKVPSDNDTNDIDVKKMKLNENVKCEEVENQLTIIESPPVVVVDAKEGEQQSKSVKNKKSVLKKKLPSKKKNILNKK